MKITSTTNNYIKAFSRLQDKKSRDEDKLFILEDEDLIKIAFSKKIVKAFLFYGELPDYDYSDVDMIEVTPEIIKKLSFLTTPRKSLCICHYLKNTEILGSPLVALDGIQDPGNGGTVARSALAFNYQGMIISNSSFDQYNDKFIRATKGSLFDLPIVRVDLVSALKEYKRNGYQIIAAELDKNAVMIKKYKPNNKYVLVLGNEGQGLSKEVRELCDVSVFIPQSKLVESLNVGVAASICMYELTRGD